MLRSGMSDWPFLMNFHRTRRGQTLALASLVGREGSSYRQPGARMLIDAAGAHVGSLSGGCLEEGIAAVGKRVIASGNPERLEIDTRPHFGCPGKLRIHVERLNPADRLLDRIERRLARRSTFMLGTGEATRFLAKSVPSAELSEFVGLQPRLVMIGGASDGAPLLRIAAELGWDLHRVLRGEHPAIVAGEKTTGCPAEEIAAVFPPDPATAVLVMTHHLATDLHFLKNLLPHSYPYIGLLGSRRRRETLLAEAGASGLLEDPTVGARLFAPVGLDLGAGHPATIALGVVAEIQAVLAGTDGGFLRDRTGTIHPRGEAWA